MKYKVYLHHEKRYFDGRIQNKIFIDTNNINEIIIAIVMLREGNCAELCIISEDVNKLVIRYLKENGISYRIDNCLLISTDGIGYILQYLLEYKRDGFASVDHIDIEMYSSFEKNNSTSCGYLTILSSSFNESMQANEIEKLMPPNSI